MTYTADDARREGEKDFLDIDFTEIEKRIMLAMAEGREGIVDYPSVTGRNPKPDDRVLERMAEFTRSVLRGVRC